MNTLRGREARYAWNRLLQVLADDSGQPGAIVATYGYDGQNRRTVRLLGANPADPDARFDYYYNDNWQVLEERLRAGHPTL